MTFKGSCKQCLKDFEKKLSPSKATRKNPFCSVECRCAYQRAHGTFKKHEHKFVDVACAVCSRTFQMETKQHAHRLRKGKTRFACSPACKKTLQSITIKEIRSTDASRAKTVVQNTEHWSDPAARKHQSDLMRAKPAAWHQARMASVLRANLSGKTTKPEAAVRDFLAVNFPTFRHTGAGEHWIGGLNPDFVSTSGPRVIVEVNGCYWHGCARCFPGSRSKGIPLNQRRTTFAKFGWHLVVVWEHDLKRPGWQDRLRRQLEDALGIKPDTPVPA